MFHLELRFDYWDREKVEQFAKKNKLIFSCTTIMDGYGKLTGTLLLPEETVVYEPLYPLVEYFKLPNRKIFVLEKGDIPRMVEEKDLCQKIRVNNIASLDWVPVRKWERGLLERLRLIAEAGL